MSKFNELYNKLILEYRGMIPAKDLESYPPQIVKAYHDFVNLRHAYYKKQAEKINKYEQISTSSTDLGEKVIFNNLLNAVANSFLKMARLEENEESEIITKDSKEQLKLQLAEYYKDKRITIEDWKKLAEILREIKNDPQIKDLHVKLTVAYQALPKTMKSLIDLPDKSNVTVADEILNQRLALQNYSNEDNTEEFDSAAMIEMTKNFVIRPLQEEDVYSVLTRANGKPFVINYMTSKGDNLIRAGKLNVMAYDNKQVNDPLEAARRLSSYNNITYYDFTGGKRGYRTAKLSNTSSISVGNFETGKGITYIIKH